MADELLSIKVPFVNEDRTMNHRWFAFFADFVRKISAQPQIFVQSADPSTDAVEGDLWIWVGTKRRENDTWVLV